MAKFIVKDGIGIIPDGTTKITECGFWRSEELTSIVIPDSVTEIGWSAFKGCSALTSVVIPNSVTKIGRQAFQDCSALTSIIIPNSVTEMGTQILKGCSALNQIIVEEGNTVYDSREGCNAIIGPNDVLLYGCNTTVIPASVKEIAEEAFFSCSTLKSITIPIDI